MSDGCSGTYVRDGAPCQGCPDCDYVAAAAKRGQHANGGESSMTAIHREALRLRKEVADLRSEVADLRDCLGDAYDWAAYAPDWARDRHGWDDFAERAERLIAAGEGSE